MLAISLYPVSLADESGFTGPDEDCHKKQAPMLPRARGILTLCGSTLWGAHIDPQPPLFANKEGGAKDAELLNGWRRAKDL